MKITLNLKEFENDKKKGLNQIPERKADEQHS
jgi:hypothetical protein